MGIFSNSSSNRSQPDLSRYDYHYRGSHINGYNVESGSTTTARQYVRQMALGNNNRKVNSYPQTRRANTLTKRPTVKQSISKPKKQPVYRDEEDLDYGEIDFDNNFTPDDDYDDDYPERYNSITSVTTTTTTTTKEVDPVTGMETVTKTIEKTLPDGSIETTIKKTQKPVSSRNSSRNNSFVGMSSPQKYSENFNNFSSENYTVNSSEPIPEEEEYEDDNIYHFTNAQTRKRLPKKSSRTQQNKVINNNDNQRMTDSEMYARALEIAREKVLSDPARLNTNKTTSKGSVLQPELIPGKQKQYSLKKSLREESTNASEKAVISNNFENVTPNEDKKENKLKKGFKSIFKKKEPQNNVPMEEKTEEKPIKEYEPVFTTQQNVMGDDLITKSLVDAGSDSEVEFVPKEDTVEEPEVRRFSTSGNNVVRSEDYVESRDIDKNQVDYISHKSYAADKRLALSSGESRDEFIDFDDDQVEKEDDVTELYNDVPDNKIVMNHTEIPDSSLLQDVPLLKTMQSENELRYALENIEEDKEIEVMKEIASKSQDEYLIPSENVDIIHDVDQHENTLVSESAKLSPEVEPLIDNEITPESEKNVSAIDEAPLVIESINQVEVPQDANVPIKTPPVLKDTTTPETPSKPVVDFTNNEQPKKKKEGKGLLKKIVKFSNENYGANVSRQTSNNEPKGSMKKKWKLFKSKKLD
ncbi:uncharacterized protein HGUI_02240 [Hanseniaspora guilliermondii]|uniref:Uncharacterized protein n=1 Tax=Hanseniaspora guilliermondii TaxID=56406 RepID=A0A1L0B0V3_9ASCO|nr:uncharacterized protein HGUI_02240 [Hanseniaspora guilliermondii]